MSDIRSTAAFVAIPIDQLFGSPTNPRKRFDLRALEELAANIREIGVLQPLLVRPIDSGTYEVVAGERRLRAARIAGVASVPCAVRDMTDEEVFRIQIAENNQRADVTPLEEADAIRRGIDDLGLSVETIAKRISRSPAYVAARYVVSCAAGEIRALLDEGLVTVGAAAILARAPSSKASSVAERARRSAASKREPLTRRDVSTLIDQYAHLLAEAPFALDDLKLQRLNARACTTCTDRTGAQASLFSDAAGDDRCLDAECWDSKLEGLWARAQRDAKKRQLRVLEEPWDGTHTGYYETRSSAYSLGRETPWRDLIPPEEAIVGRTPEGRIVELVGPATVQRLRGEAARQADRDGDDSEAGGAESEAERDERLASARIQRDRESLARFFPERVRSLLARFDAEVSDLDAIRVIVTPRDSLARVHALHLGLVQPGDGDGAAREALTTWLAQASQRDLVRMLVTTALIDGWLEDDETLDGLLAPLDGDEDEATAAE